MTGLKHQKPNSGVALGANAEIDLKALVPANAYGPYAHATLVSQDLSVRNEEALSERGAFPVSHIRRAILEKFTNDQIRGMTLVVTQIFAELPIHNFHQP